MKFIDFCSGIGGGRLGLTNVGYECIAFSEIDSIAIKTYKLMYSDDEINYGDITNIESDYLPDFDLLIGGFPCQAFSIIGTRCGLNDIDRGQIIYYLSRIIEEKNIKYFILENVKGLINHDHGRTLNIIINILEDIGYKIYYKVLNSLDYGIPHMRERIYFVGIREDLYNGTDFNFPEPYLKTLSLENYLIDDDNSLVLDETDKTYSTFIKYLNNKYNEGKYDLKEILSQEYLVLDTRQSDLRIYKNKIPTIRKGRQGILYVKNGKLRRLSGIEAFLLQGIPLENIKKIKDKVSNTNMLGLAGNAMTVNVIEAIAKSLNKYINTKETKNMDLVERGSKTAKDGFKNEDFVVAQFNNWNQSDLAQDWLNKMNYNLKEIKSVKAEKISGHKADVQVQIKITIEFNDLIDVQNLQVKLVSNPKGFNQIDKRWLKSYNELWGIPPSTYKLLQHFTGELPPKITGPKDSRRMFLDEFSEKEKEEVLGFFRNNKTMIVSDILKGRGKFSAEWMLVILKVGTTLKWELEPINYVLNFFGNGEVSMTPRGSISIGKITVQRKGGDGGRDTANMLQFKINPAELID